MIGITITHFDTKRCDFGKICSAGHIDTRRTRFTTGVLNTGDVIYVQASAAGMTLFDLPRSRAERDLEQWQAIIDWVEGSDRAED